MLPLVLITGCECGGVVHSTQEINNAKKTCMRTQHTQNQCALVVAHGRSIETSLFLFETFPNRTKQVLTFVVYFGDGQPKSLNKIS